MKTQSYWRLHARRVIRDTLAALPPGSTLAEQRNAVAAAYPFAERMGWAYRCWCKEVALELGPYRRGTKPVQATTVQVALAPDRVVCGWCQQGEGGPARGCVFCLRHRRWHEELARRGLLADALALQAACPDKLLDWLKDRGIEEGGCGGG